jgi:hypothetical protein
MINSTIRIGKELYILMGIEDIKYEHKASEWNSLSPLHKVFKKENFLYFCKAIEDAKIYKPKRKYIKKNERINKS